MIRLNRMTDYAIVILGQMAQDVGRVRTAGALAEATGVRLALLTGRDSHKQKKETIRQPQSVPPLCNFK